MSKEEDLVQAYPEGEVEIAGDQPAETVTSLDTFAGKVHVKWAPEAAVSSLGLMPFFIEFLKTSGLFDKWVEDCPLHYTSGNAPEKRDVLGTLVLSVLAGHWRYAHINAIRADDVNPGLLGMTGVASEDSVRRGMKAMDEAGRRSGWCWTWRCRRGIRRLRCMRNRNCGHSWTDCRSGPGQYSCAGTAIGDRRKPWLEPRSESLGTCSNSSRARM